MSLRRADVPSSTFRYARHSFDLPMTKPTCAGVELDQSGHQSRADYILFSALNGVPRTLPVFVFRDIKA